MKANASNKPATEKLAVTVPAAAALVDVCPAVGYEYAASGKWPVLRIGRSVRIPVEGLREWVKQNSSAARPSEASDDARLRAPA